MSARPPVAIISEVLKTIARQPVRMSALRMLCHLAREEREWTTVELGEALSLAPSNVSQISTYLEQRKMLTRRRVTKSAHKTIYLVQLAPAGREMVEQLVKQLLGGGHAL